VKYMVLAVSLFLIGSTFAGCGDEEGECLVVTGDKEMKVKCSVTVCANAYSYFSKWILDNGTSVSVDYKDNVETILIDSAKGYRVPSSIVKKELTCFATIENKNVYCAKDISM
jgi:hypothetical protein